MIPRENDYLWGHEKEYDCFKQAIMQHKFHHAWIIYGEDGIGKTTFVYHVIRLILGNSPAVINRIKKGSHADLLTVARRMDEKKGRLRSEILMEDIKSVGEFLRLTPAEGGWRIVIIEDAELMNQNAANSLLKLLEEPPQAALIFLITSHPNRLLPTILSRCQKMMLHPVSDQDLQKGLRVLLPDVSDEKIQEILPLAEGAFGKAIQLLEKDSLMLQDIAKTLVYAPVQGKELYQKIDLILQKENGFSIFLDLLTDVIHAAIDKAIKEKKERFGNPLRTVPEWVEIWQTILKWHKETESFNLDKKQTLISEFNLVSEL